jgi:hypothetical protein
MGSNISKWFDGRFVMKWAKIVLACVLAAGAGAASAQHFHHARVGVGVYIGPGWYYPYPHYVYPPVYYAYPPVVVAPSGPPVYIEQGQAQAPDAPPAPAQPSPNYWYYCSNPEGYYPYVKQCPGGWQQVEPRPPAQPSK